MNRLQSETSPYLRQHQDNPVDWFAWSAEAFERAKREDKPILLSVGYSACHWCHVMAHESFEHQPTAEMMNRYCINVKVDREERPDVDGIYMQAVMAFTRGHGGWPMTVFLTPDGRPFAGGTYFPREPRYGMPSFMQILQGVHDAWTKRRDEIELIANDLTAHLDRDVLGIPTAERDTLTSDMLKQVARRLVQQTDKLEGGFGGAPKFPQPMSLEFMLRMVTHEPDADLLTAIELTLIKMAHGGIYDQIGGGFARYSVDHLWLVPHFEKMLYDNAQLSRVYLQAWQLTKRPLYLRIATEIYDYILREMTAPEGGFYSATDADSEGEEGKFFVWQVDELVEVLGQTDAEMLMDYYGVTMGGNFEGANILHITMSIEEIADQYGMTEAEFETTLHALNQKLYAYRSQRVAPALDDKMLSSWNGMMLASLAEAARVLKRTDYRTAAIRCGEFILNGMRAPDGRLWRTYNHGRAKLNGYLEDYANVIDAMLELYQLTFDEKWFSVAVDLADYVLASFATTDGGFYDTSHDHEALIVRPRTLQDSAVPSGNTMIAKQLLRLHAFTGDHRYREPAEKVLLTLLNPMQEFPTAFAQALNGADLLVNGVHEVALVGDENSEAWGSLRDVLHETYRPRMVIAHCADPEMPTRIPLLHGRVAQDNRVTAYVCREFICRLPVHDAHALRELL